MIWLAGQLWPAALLALISGFALTWFTVVRRVPTSSDEDAPRHRDDASRPRAGDDPPHGAHRAEASGASPAPTRQFDEEIPGANRSDDDARPDAPASRSSGGVGSAFTSRRDE